MYARGPDRGGVLSPLLFSIFVDDILVKLRESGCGCFISNCCFNAMMYADDLVLLAISITDMMIMLKICKDELSWLDMRLNVGKSCALRVGERWNVAIPPLTVGGIDIPWVGEIRYLG